MLITRQARQHAGDDDARDQELADRLPELQHVLEHAKAALSEGYLARMFAE